MIETEAERQFYLGVAGIRLWYARSPLPGAAPSPEFEFPGPSEDAPEEKEWESSKPVAEAGPAAAPAAGGNRVRPAGGVNLQSLMETPAPEPASAETAPRPTKSESGPAPENDTPPSASRRIPGESGAAPFRHKLNLRLWFGQRFLLVSDVSGEASLRLQETLAENILKSLGDPGPQTSGPVLWPVFNNPLIPGNRLSDLIDVLKGVLSPLDGQRVVLLGVPGSEEEAAGAHWLVEALGKKPDVIFPHNLAELAGNPELKKNLWRQLKPLV